MKALVSCIELEVNLITTYRSWSELATATYTCSIFVEQEWHGREYQGYAPDQTRAPVQPELYLGENSQTLRAVVVGWNAGYEEQ